MNAHAPADHPELPLMRAGHRVSDEQLARDVADLEGMLLEAGTMKCVEIEAVRPEWASPDGRYVRRLASMSGNILSAPGVPYRHERRVSDPALDELIARRKAQIAAEGRELVRLIRLRGLRRATSTLTGGAA